MEKPEGLDPKIMAPIEGEHFLCEKCRTGQSPQLCQACRHNARLIEAIRRDNLLIRKVNEELRSEIANISELLVRSKESM